MTDEIQQIVTQLENGQAEEAADRTGLSAADVSAIRNTPLWRLRQKLVNQSGDSDGTD